MAAWNITNPRFTGISALFAAAPGAADRDARAARDYVDLICCWVKPLAYQTHSSCALERLSVYLMFVRERPQRNGNNRSDFREVFLLKSTRWAQATPPTPPPDRAVGRFGLLCLLNLPFPNRGPESANSANSFARWGDHIKRCTFVMFALYSWG